MRAHFVLAAVAVATLGGCGDDGSSGSSPSAPAALQPPVAVNAAGAAPTSAGDDGRMTAEAASTDMSAMPVFAGFTYEVGEGLPSLPPNSTGYQYPPGADVDEATVAALAAALGVDAVPVRVDDPAMGLLWRAGPDDGSAPSLMVSRDPQLSWYYSAPWADQQVICAAPAVGGEPATTTTSLVGGDAVVGGGTDPCAPEPPAGVPSAEEAGAAASDLLAAIGEDPSAYELETYADQWSASVTAWPSLDGVRSPLTWGFGFGAEGALQWANGSFAVPVPAGPYPLVDLDAALARLSDRGGGVEPLPAPGPVDTLEPLEPEIATLVDVRADLWWASDADGSVWLVPAYTFIDTEDRPHTVPAVTDEFLVVDEPAVDVPLPEPLPEPALSPTTTPGETPPSSTEPFDPALVLGLTVEEADKVLSGQGMTLRVSREDGVDLIVTDDFRPDRVNVAVDAGLITEVVGLF